MIGGIQSAIGYCKRKRIFSTVSKDMLHHYLDFYRRSRLYISGKSGKPAGASNQQDGWQESRYAIDRQVARESSIRDVQDVAGASDRVGICRASKRFCFLLSQTETLDRGSP